MKEIIRKKCRYCGKEILLVPIKRGRVQPCEPELIPFWWEPKGEEIFITQEGETATGSRDGKPDELTDVGYVPHYCPERQEVRRCRD